MLKPVDHGSSPPERPVGELVSELIDVGKAYARAEVGWPRLIAAAKARAWHCPGVVRDRARRRLGRGLRIGRTGSSLPLATLIGPAGRRLYRHADLRRNRRRVGWYGLER